MRGSNQVYPCVCTSHSRAYSIYGEVHVRFSRPGPAGSGARAQTPDRLFLLGAALKCVRSSETEEQRQKEQLEEQQRQLLKEREEELQRQQERKRLPW